MNSQDFRTIPTEELIEELKSGRDDLILLDVREPKEYQGEFDGFSNYYNIPLYDLDPFSDLFEDNEDKTFVLICESGARAYVAQEQLEEDGVDNTIILETGLRTWRKLDPKF